MRSLPVRIAPEEYERVVEIGEVHLDGYVVQPWLDSVMVPFGVDGGFEDECVGRDEAFESPRPAVAVDLVALGHRGNTIE